MIRCEIPGCTSQDGVDVMLSWEGHEWCIGHAADDWLPSITYGRLSGCIVCKRTCITWTEHGCMHEGCRRNWAIGKPPEAKVGTVKKGAYARRSVPA